MVTHRLCRSGQMRHLDASGKSIDSDGAQVGSVLDDFHAGDRARLQETEHGIPVIGRTIAQPQRHAGFRTGWRRWKFFAAMRWEADERGRENFVKSADTAESGRQRNFGHRHLRFVDQLLREENAPGLRHRDRRGAQMLNEQPPEVAFADAEAFRERFDAGVVAVKRAIAQSEQAREKPYSKFRARRPDRAPSPGGSAGRDEIRLPAPPPRNRRSGSSPASPCARGTPAGSRSRSR